MKHRLTLFFSFIFFGSSISWSVDLARTSLCQGVFSLGTSEIKSVNLLNFRYPSRLHDNLKDVIEGGRHITLRTHVVVENDLAPGEFADFGRPVRLTVDRLDGRWDDVNIHNHRVVFKKGVYLKPEPVDGLMIGSGDEIEFGFQLSRDNRVYFVPKVTQNGYIKRDISVSIIDGSESSLKIKVSSIRYFSRLADSGEHDIIEFIVDFSGITQQTPGRTGPAIVQPARNPQSITSPVEVAGETDWRTKLSRHMEAIRRTTENLSPAQKAKVKEIYEDKTCYSCLEDFTPEDQPVQSNSASSGYGFGVIRYNPFGIMFVCPKCLATSIERNANHPLPAGAGQPRDPIDPKNDVIDVGMVLREPAGNSIRD